MKKPAVHANHHVQHRFPREVRFCALCGGAMEPRTVLPDKKELPVCKECGFVFFPSPKLVAGCLVVESGSVLLIRRGNEPALGKWTHPGGFVDFAERAIDAAVRETFEEVGLEVSVEHLLGVYTDSSNHNTQSIVYLSRVERGELRPSEEAPEARFFTPADIPWDQLAFPSTHAALTEWAQLVSDTKKLV